MGRRLLLLLKQHVTIRNGTYTGTRDNFFRVGIFLGFVRLATRTEGPHVGCTCGEPNKMGLAPIGVVLSATIGDGTRIPAAHCSVASVSPPHAWSEQIITGLRGSCLLTATSGNIFRVGVVLDSVWLATRTMHPHGAYARGARRNRIVPPLVRN